MKKLLAYAAAGVVVQQIGGYMYYRTESAIKDQLDAIRRRARSQGWSEGWDEGFYQAQLSLIPYINDEHWEHMHGKSFREFLDQTRP